MSDAIVRMRQADRGFFIQVIGTCFTVEGVTLTANHNLDPQGFLPQQGERLAGMFICEEAGAVTRIEEHQLRRFPEKDVAVTRSFRSQTFKYHRADPGLLPASVTARGYIATNEPPAMMGWGDHQEPVPRIMDWEAIRQSATGIGTSTFHYEHASGHSGVVTSAAMSLYVGISGGPMLDGATGNVLGVFTMGLPPDVPLKHTAMAIRLEDIPELAEEFTAAKP